MKLFIAYVVTTDSGRSGFGNTVLEMAPEFKMTVSAITALQNAMRERLSKLQDIGPVASITMLSWAPVEDDPENDIVEEHSEGEDQSRGE